MASVLVVDDTAVDRRLAGGLLEKSTSLEVRYAENGQLALEAIDCELPDLVLTDLQMPDLDGLQLVTLMNERFPEVPVVLMTAHGSEAIAAQALANGAASYVAKSELADSLVDTAMQILSLSESDQRYNRLIRCSTKTEFEFELDNDIKLIDPLVDLVQQVVASMDLCDSTGRVRLGVALENALSNAMVRGNLEIPHQENHVLDNRLVSERIDQSPYNDRKVFVNARVDRDKAEFVIRDQGPGFDTGIVPNSKDPDSFKDGARRGLVLITAFMDDVQFKNSGREIHMTKFRNGSSS